MNQPPQMDMSGVDAQEEEDQALQHSGFEVLRDMPNPASDRVQKAQIARGADPQQLALQGVVAKLCSHSCCGMPVGCSEVMLFLLQSTCWPPSLCQRQARAGNISSGVWMLAKPAGTAWPVTWRSALPCRLQQPDCGAAAPGCAEGA